MAKPPEKEKRGDRDPEIRRAARIQHEAERLRETRLSGKAMARRFGVSYATFRRGLENDPGALSCAVQIPCPGGSITRFRAWELEERWSRPAPPRRKVTT